MSLNHLGKREWFCLACFQFIIGGFTSVGGLVEQSFHVATEALGFILYAVSRKETCHDLVLSSLELLVILS